MRISIVIPCHNGVADTRACLESVSATRVPGAADPEVLIVDNASTDDTGALAAEFPFVRVLPQPTNLGFAGGVNRGLEAATGDSIVVLNNDTMLATRTLERLVQPLGSGVAVTAPVSNHVKGPAQIDVGDVGLEPAGRAEIEALLDEHAIAHLQDVETVSGLCMAFRRELLDEVDGFDESFGPGNWEDDDFCLRVRLLGHRLAIVRRAFLHHRGHRTFRALGLDIDREITAREATFRAKWRDDPAGRAYLARLDGDAAAAARAAAEARRRYPDWPDADLLLARYAGRRGDAAAALEHAQRFVSHCPFHSEARLLVALLTADTGDFELGAQRFDATLNDCHFGTTDLAQALCQFARRCLAVGRFDAAIGHLDSARALVPDDAEPLNVLGVAYLETGRCADAEPLLRTAHEAGNVDATTNLGVCLWQLGRTDEGLRLLHEAVERDPNHAVARANLQAAAAVRVE